MENDFCCCTRRSPRLVQLNHVYIQAEWNWLFDHAYGQIHIIPRYSSTHDMPLVAVRLVQEQTVFASLELKLDVGCNEVHLALLKLGLLAVSSHSGTALCGK